MDKINFQDLPSTQTPIDATHMNLLQTNIENGIKDAGVIVSSTEPQNNDRRKVWLQHSKNLFDKNVITDTSFTVKYQSIEVKPNTDYTLSTDGGSSSSALLFLTTDISSTSTTNNGAWLNSPRTINSGNNTTMYVGYRGDLSSYWIQLETGSTATTYEPYGDNIYILDKDNIYREFNTINEDINGKKIWENTSPSSDFAGQTVTFNTSGYDMYKVFYRMNKTYTYMKAEELIVGQRGILTIPHTDGFNADPVSRWITSITNNSITFGNASINNATNNNYLIPIYVIGYKTGLFS